MLVDTHILIWYLEGVMGHMGAKSYDLLRQKEANMVVSAASLLEIRLKQRRGGLKDFSVDEIITALHAHNIPIISISAEHAARVCDADTVAHADLFDLLLVAQAIEQGLSLFTCDKAILDLALPGLRLIDARN